MVWAVVERRTAASRSVAAAPTGAHQVQGGGGGSFLSPVSSLPPWHDRSDSVSQGLFSAWVAGSGTWVARSGAWDSICHTATSVHGAGLGHWILDPSGWIKRPHRLGATPTTVVGNFSWWWVVNIGSVGNTCRNQ